ncbi:MAG: hypothetical protein AAGF53_18165 [Pseudomonadota bacterium]
MDHRITSIRFSEGTNAAFARQYGAEDLVKLINEELDQGDGPKRHHIKWYLDGPNYGTDIQTVCFAILMVCLAQWHLDESDHSHNIRDKLLALFDVTSSLIGLPALWSKLGEQLKTDGVELVLPTVPRSRRLVGTHQALVFPLYVHRRSMRAVIQRIPEEHRSDTRLSISLQNIDVVSGAMRKHFIDWKNLASEMDPDAYQTPFWLTVEEERLHLATRSRLAVRTTDDFPPSLALFEEFPSGEHKQRDDPTEFTSPSKAVSKAWRTRSIGLTDQGFGNWVECTADQHPDKWLKQQTTDISQEELSSPEAILPVGSGSWHLAEPVEKRKAANLYSERIGAVERKEGIRVGRRVLHRYPFVPWYRSRHSNGLIFYLDGGELEKETDTDGYQRPVVSSIDGATDLKIVGGGKTPCLKVAAAGQAQRHPLRRFREFRVGEAQHDDGALRETLPIVKGPLPSAPEPTARTTDELIVSLGEALYARSVRGIGVGEAFELVKRISPNRPDVCWALLRSFVNSGWFDPVWRHGTCAQALLPRSTRFIERGGQLLLDGLLCEDLLKGISATAERLGGRFLIFDSKKTLAPPCYVVDSMQQEKRDSLFKETGVPLYTEKYVEPPSISSLADDPDLSLYKPMFTQFGVGRLERKDSKGPPRWSARLDGYSDIHVSKTTAQLHSAVATGSKIFSWKDGLLWTAGPGRFLPAAWSRWLRLRTLQCGGVYTEANGGMERYVYPCDKAAAEAIAAVCPVVGVSDASTHRTELGV